LHFCLPASILMIILFPTTIQISMKTMRPFFLKLHHGLHHMTTLPPKIFITHMLSTID
jgi:uncharacterized membrane protein YhfC